MVCLFAAAAERDSCCSFLCINKKVCLYSSLLGVIDRDRAVQRPILLMLLYADYQKETARYRQRQNPPSEAAAMTGRPPAAAVAAAAAIRGAPGGPWRPVCCVY